MDATFAMKKLLIALLGILLLPSLSLAATYYVSPTGSATWGVACQSVVSGTSACSLSDAESNATAGDVVYLRGGTYNLPYKDASPTWVAGFMPENSGTSGSPITFQAYLGETVFFDNSANAGQSDAVASYGAWEVDYIIFDGIDTKGAPKAAGDAIATYLHGSVGSIIRNANIEGTLTGTTNSNNIRVEHSDYHEVYNNVLYNSTGTNNSTGITSYWSTYGDIYNNTIYNCNQGIYDKTGGQYNKYRHNFLRSNFIGIGISAATNPNPQPIGLEIYHNIIVNGTDIGIWDNSAADPGAGLLIYNNSLYSNDRHGIILSSSSVTNYEIFNNIVNGHSLSEFTVPGGTTSYYANNSTTDTFDNAGGTTPEDYQRTSYPTDGRGGSYSNVMGAWISDTNPTQIGASSGGVADTTNPTFSSATANGSTFQITLSEDVTITGLSNGDFVATGSTTGASNLNSCTESAGVISCTAADTFIYGETITLAYTTGTDEVEDLAGNDLASFSGASVTNNTAQIFTSALTRAGNGTTRVGTGTIQ